MKLTKVDRTRFAIGKIKDDGSPEKIFYRSPNGGSNDKNTAVGDVVKERVKNAFHT